MEEKNTVKRKEWIKNVAIIFLVIMLILTFFSNTIMNYSLPEVATQYVQSGSITAKVRGTGKVEASDPYNVIAKESRVIESVAVKQGDVVEKDQVLYYLEDAESDELLKAQDELEDLELAYMKGMFGGNASPEVIGKVSNGNVDSFGQLQAKVTDMQNRLDEAKKRVEECQKVVDELTLQSTKSTNDATVSTKSEELSKDQATTDLTNAKERFEKDKAATVAELNAEITELQNQIKDLETLITATDADVAGTAVSTGSGTTTDSSYDAQKKTLVGKLHDKVTEIKTAATTTSSGSIAIPGADGVTIGDKNVSTVEKTAETLKNVKSAFSSLQNLISTAQKTADYQTLFADYNAILIQINDLEQTSDNLNSYTSKTEELNQKKNRLAQLQSRLAQVQAITATSDEEVKNAQSRLDQANRNILEITTANSQTSVAWQNKLADANAALKNAQAVYDLLKEEQTTLAANINAELDLSKASKDIEEKKEEIERLKAKSMGAAVTAPVAGTVSNMAYVAGETTKPEEVMAVILPEGKGFTLSVSVTTEQAKKVQIGDMAELQNSWYYEDARVMLSAIKPDPEDPASKKLLVFDVSGSSIQADQTLSISVGQRSQDYDLVVPNSAIREDNDGKFILIVESKSSPLGNRYIATRVGVEVVASDDNNTAVTAPLYGWEYVITTSTKPVEAGKQVRLANQ